MQNQETISFSGQKLLAKGEGFRLTDYWCEARVGFHRASGP